MKHNNWGKRVKPPMEHTFFAASYRQGYMDGQRSFQKLPATYFGVENRERAHAAYLAGYEMGKQERSNDAA